MLHAATQTLFCRNAKKTILSSTTILIPNKKLYLNSFLYTFQERQNIWRHTVPTAKLTFVVGQDQI